MCPSRQLGVTVSGAAALSASLPSRRASASRRACVLLVLLPLLPLLLLSLLLPPAASLPSGSSRQRPSSHS